MTTMEINGETGRLKNVDEKLIERLTEYLAKSRPYSDYRFSDRSENELRRMLQSWQRDLSMKVAICPRNAGEKLSDYVKRLEVSGRGVPQLGAVHILFDRIAAVKIALQGHELQRREEQRQKERELHEQAQRVREHEEQLRRAMKPDKVRVRELQKMIEDAEKGEAFLAKLYDAMSAFRRARDARGELAKIYEDAAIACRHFGREAPTPPNIKPADRRAVEAYDLLAARPIPRSDPQPAFRRFEAV